MADTEVLTTQTVTTTVVESSDNLTQEEFERLRQELMRQRVQVTLHVYFRRGTVKAMKRFEVQEQCERLKAGMKGFGTEEKVLIDVLTGTSNEQRQEIVREYKVMFGKDLIDDVKSETSGNYGKVCVGLLRTPAEYDAECLMKAMKGLGTDEDTMIEIICTCSNEEMEELKEAYLKEYGKSLEDAVNGDTSGDFQRVMVSLIQAGRSTDRTNPVSAAADAQALYDAGEGQWGTDESVFNAILVSRSFSQLRAIFVEYEKLANRSIMEAIDSELSGDLQRTMKTIVQVVQDKTLYYVERLHKSMKGLGTDDDTLIRVILRTCESVLADIKDVFYQKYDDTLANWIIGDTSGDYQDILLAIIGERKPKE